MKAEQAYKILGGEVESDRISALEAYGILKLVVGKFLERNQFTYITAESKWRNILLSLFFPSVLLSTSNLMQEMHEMSLLLHRLDERLESKNELEKSKD